MEKVYLVVSETTVYKENGQELLSVNNNWSAHTTHEKALNAIKKYIKMTREREHETRCWKIETIFIDD